MLSTKYPQNHVEFLDKINSASVAQLLSNVYKRLNVEGQIGLDIRSDGGSITHALRAYDAIVAQEGRVITKNLQYVGSSALLLYCVGARRCAVPNAVFIVHAIETRINSKRFESKSKLYDFRARLVAGDYPEATKEIGYKDRNLALAIVDQVITSRAVQEDRYIRIVQSRTGLSPQEVRSRFLTDGQSDISLQEAIDLNLVNAYLT